MSFRTGERTCPHIKFNLFFFFLFQKIEDQPLISHPPGRSLSYFISDQRERLEVQRYIDSKSLYTSSLSLSLSIYLITYLYNRDGYIEVQTDVTSSLIHTSLSICLYICLSLCLSLSSLFSYFLHPSMHLFFPSFLRMDIYGLFILQ